MKSIFKDYKLQNIYDLIVYINFIKNPNFKRNVSIHRQSVKKPCKKGEDKYKILEYELITELEKEKQHEGQSREEILSREMEEKQECLQVNPRDLSLEEKNKTKILELNDAIKETNKQIIKLNNKKNNFEKILENLEQLEQRKLKLLKSEELKKFEGLIKRYPILIEKKNKRVLN